MTPNKALNEIRAGLRGYGYSTTDDQADSWIDTVSEAFQYLDLWLTRGGEPPEDWKGGWDTDD